LRRGRRRLCQRRGQEEQWVDVSLGLRGRSHAEVDVRLDLLRLTGAAGECDGIAFGDRRALSDG
jgi:hypothetical protein